MRVAVISSILSVLVALPSTAGAQSAAERVAARASKAHDTYCAEVAGVGDESDAALALVEVGAAWAEVAQVYEATGTEWLLYWRGVLAQCLSQDDRAAEALSAFLASDTATEGLAAMVGDARKRLRRLRPDYVPPSSAKPPPTPEDRQRAGRAAGGVVLALGAAGAGVGSGVGFAQFSGTRAAVTTELLLASESEALITQGSGQVVAGVGLAIGAGVAAVASIAAFAGSGRSGGARVVVAPTAVAGGVGLVVGGRW